MELRIIYAHLKKSREDQLDEIKKSFNWEMDTMRQELTSEADGRIAQDIC